MEMAPLESRPTDESRDDAENSYAAEIGTDKGNGVAWCGAAAGGHLSFLSRRRPSQSEKRKENKKGERG